MAFVNLLEIVYPIGSIFMSISNISPAEVVGGQWEKIKEGLLGCAETEGLALAGQTGGSFTITTDQIPSHGHGFNCKPWASALGGLGCAVAKEGNSFVNGGEDPSKEGFIEPSGGGNPSIQSIFQSMFGEGLRNLKGGCVVWLL